MGSEPKARAVEPEQRRGPEKKKVHALLNAAGLGALLLCAYMHNLTVVLDLCKPSRTEPCMSLIR